MVTIEFQHEVGRVYFDGGQTEAGKNVMLTVHNPRANLTAVALEATMKAIIASGVFEVNGAPLETSKGARIVKRNVTELATVQHKKYGSPVPN